MAKPAFGDAVPVVFAVQWDCVCSAAERSLATLDSCYGAAVDRVSPNGTVVGHLAVERVEQRFGGTRKQGIDPMRSP